MRERPRRKDVSSRPASPDGVERAGTVPPEVRPVLLPTTKPTTAKATAPATPPTIKGSILLRPPSTVRVFPSLTRDVCDGRWVLDRPAQRRGAETRHEGTSITSGVALDKQERTALENESPIREASNAASEKRPEPLPNSPFCERQPQLTGHQPRSTGRLAGQPGATLQKNRPRIRSLHHQPHEIAELLIRDLVALLGFLLVGPYPALHHITQTQPAGHRDRCVLLLENLEGPITRLEDLQNGEGNQSRHPLAPAGDGFCSCLLRGLVDGRARQEAVEGIRGSSPGMPRPQSRRPSVTRQRKRDPVQRVY